VVGVSQYTTLGWLALTAMLAVVRRAELASVLLRWWPLLLAPLIAAVSFIWSETPDISMKYGVQLLATAFVGLLIARCLSPTKFVTALFLATLLFCVMSIASGRQGAASEGTVLIGLVGSKNQMSAMGYTLAFAAFATAVNPLAPRLARILTLPGFLIGGYVVATTASATAVLMTIGCLGLFAALLVLQPLSPAGRIGAVLALVLVCSPIVLLLPEIERAITDFIINVLHKDPGLTGRDFLWAQADRMIAAKPILGHGFQSFWLGGSPEAVALLQAFRIDDPRSFNFHNTFRQVAVDTGFFGLTVFAATLGFSLLAGLRQLTLRPTIATTFCFTFLAAAVARMYTEMMMVTFSIHTALIFTCLAYAFWRPQPGWDEDSAQAAESYAYAHSPAPPLATPHYRLERHALRAPAAFTDQTPPQA
jgi:exopolysaccharide production protein ExoQ